VASQLFRGLSTVSPNDCTGEIVQPPKRDAVIHLPHLHVIPIARGGDCALHGFIRKITSPFDSPKVLPISDLGVLFKAVTEIVTIQLQNGVSLDRRTDAIPTSCIVGKLRKYPICRLRC
jgi:hypothetical protein